MGAFIGLIVAGLCVLAAVILKGGSPLGLISVPALVEVTGGVMGVLMAGSGPGAAGTIFKLLFSVGMKSPKERRPELITTLVGFSEKARREGLLALEEDAKQVDDVFLQKGIRLVVDGTDPELVQDILEAEMEGTETRHRFGQKIYKDGGGFAPTVGILGTVLSLVEVMMDLDKPDTLGPKISSAFLATFYGVAYANLFFYPVANHLAAMTQTEMAEKALILEGVLSIQSGDNPRVLAEKLWSFIPPPLREAEGGAGGGAADDAMAA
ncbi:MAG: MotA/TolQ/ExbB proton channel family protein [Thermoleophilia bacterium]